MGAMVVEAISQALTESLTRMNWPTSITGCALRLNADCGTAAGMLGGGAATGAGSAAALFFGGRGMVRLKQAGVQVRAVKAGRHGYGENAWICLRWDDALCFLRPRCAWCWWIRRFAQRCGGLKLLEKNEAENARKITRWILGGMEG